MHGVMRSNIWTYIPWYPAQVDLDLLPRISGQIRITRFNNFTISLCVAKSTLVFVYMCMYYVMYLLQSSDTYVDNVMARRVVSFST